jgi:ribosomal protein S18 acetylase RimI-like enzyme
MTERIKPVESLNLGPARVDDAAEVARVFLESSEKPYEEVATHHPEGWFDGQMQILEDIYDAAFWRDKIKATEMPDPKLKFIIARFGDRPIGFLSIEKRPTHYFLDSLYVLPEAQGIGLGNLLMEEAIYFAGDKPIDVEVMENSDKAIGFYQNCGFVKQGGSYQLNQGTAPVFKMRREARGEK